MTRAPRVLLPVGSGINCQAETAHAFRLAGAAVETPHWNDLLASPGRLARAEILALAGGFSFGDHLGAGRVLANRLRARLGPELDRFVAGGGLVLGICNGFQVMARLGLLPGGRVGRPEISLAPNARGTFHDGWVTLAADAASPCLFTRGIGRLEVPVRHGEGRLAAGDETWRHLEREALVPLRYVDPITGAPTGDFPHNPNGSPGGAAAVCDASGRLLGLMPHPEACLYPESHPRWRLGDAPPAAAGLAIFENAVAAARGR